MSGVCEILYWMDIGWMPLSLSLGALAMRMLSLMMKRVLYICIEEYACSTQYPEPDRVVIGGRPSSMWRLYICTYAEHASCDIDGVGMCIAMS